MGVVGDRRMNMLVVSGGQTGADQAGLEAARDSGFKTAGFAPTGFKTENGPQHWLGTVYGLVEHPGGYAARTRKNVEIADATVVFAHDWASAGTVCTLNAIASLHKPCLRVELSYFMTVKGMVEWLKVNSVKTLNVAGHRESVYPGCNQLVYDYLMEVFRK